MRLWLAGALIAGAAAVISAPASARGQDDDDWEDVLEDRREFFEDMREREREYWEDRREAERDYWDRARDWRDRDDWWDDGRRSWRRSYYREPYGYDVDRPSYYFDRPYGYYGYYQPYYSNFRFGPVYGGWGQPYGYYDYYRPRGDGFRFYLGW